MPPAKVQKQPNGELVKNFKCSTCHRSFTRSEHRARHELSHSDRRPYKCKDCSSTFVRRDLLLRHTRTVHAPPEVKMAKAHGRTASRQEAQRVAQAFAPTPPQPQQVPQQPTDIYGGKPLGMYQPGQQPGQPTIHQPQSLPQAGYGMFVQWPHSQIVQMPQASVPVPSMNGLALPPTPNMMYIQPNPPSRAKTTDSHPSSDSQEVSTAMFLTEMHNSPMSAPKSQPSTPGQRSLPIVPSLQALPPPLPNQHNQNGNVVFGNGQPGRMSMHDYNLHQSTELSAASAAAAAAAAAYGAPDPSMAPVPGGETLPPLTAKEIQAISQAFTEEFSMASLENEEQTPITLPTVELPSPTLTFDNSKASEGEFASLDEIDQVTLPQFASEHDSARLIENLRQHPSSLGGVNVLPTHAQLDRYISLYFNFVHPLLPMLHPQTFKCSEAPLALLAAICALGATASHERSMAQLLNYNCRLLVTMVPPAPPPPSQAQQTQAQPASQPLDQQHHASLLAQTQAMVFMLTSVTFNGDRGTLDLVTSMAIQVVQNIFALIRDVDSLCTRADETSRQRWVVREEIIRAFWMGYCVLLLLHEHCGVPLNFDFGSVPDSMPLPSAEMLWNGTFKRDKDWIHYHREIGAQQPVLNFGELMALVKSGDSSKFPSSLSPLSLRVLAVTVSMVRDRTLLRNGIALWSHARRDLLPGRGQCGLMTRSSVPYIRMISAMGLQDPTMNNGSHIVAALAANLHPLILTTYVLIDSAYMSGIIDLSLWRNNLGHLDPHAIAQAAYDCAMRPLTAEQLDRLMPMAVRTFDLITSALALGPHLLAVVMASPMSLYLPHLFVLSVEEVMVTTVWFHRVSRLQRASLTPDQQRVLAWCELTAQKVGIEPIAGSLGAAVADSAARCYESVKPWTTCEIVGFSFRILISHLTS